MSGAIYTEFGEDIGHTSTLPEIFRISNMLLCFETRIRQRRMMWKIHAKFRTFFTHVKGGGLTALSELIFPSST